MQPYSRLTNLYYVGDRYQYLYDYINPVSITHSVASPFSGVADTFSGELNPKWRDQVRLGVNATTSASGKRYSVSNVGPTTFGFDVFGHKKISPTITRGEKLDHIRYGFYSPLVVVPSSPSASGSVVSNVTNRVIVKFLDSCQEARTIFESGQDLGEYRETLHSIHRPLGSLQDKLHGYFAQLTKAKRVTPKRHLAKVLADTYLELHFGVLPLVDDIAQAVVRTGNFVFPTIPVKASAHQRYLGSTFEGNEGGGRGTVLYRRNSYSTYSVRYKGAIRSTTLPDSRISIMQGYRLLPRDWLPTAWDLLPYSWIADYFANIGDIIQSLCFVFSDLTWACKSTVDENSVQTNIVDFDRTEFNTLLDSTYVADKKTSYFYPSNPVICSCRIFTRSALVGSDLVPRFQFRIPTSKFPFYNIASILLSRYSKLLPFF